MKKTFKAFVLMTFTLMIAAIMAFSASASAPIPGDVNGDGRVTVADSVAILLYITGKNTNIAKPCYHKGTVAIDEAVERTCTVDGKSAGVHCTACGEVLLEQEPLTAQGHTESDWIVDKESVGSEDGLKHTECTVCGTKIKEEAIPGVVIESLAYTVNADGTTCTVTGIGTYQGNDVVIPTKIDGYTVTDIGDKAFADQMQITSFFIPNTVKSIGTRAFYGCTGITEITIPESVTSIGTQIFYKASNLKTVYYNSSYGSVDNPILAQESLERIVFGGTIIPDYIAYCCGNIKEILITDTINRIGNSSFYQCDNLTEVYIPDSVSSIGSLAFYNCKNLKTLRLSDNVTTLYFQTFRDCRNLETVYVGKQMSKILDGVFLGCVSIKSVYITDLMAWMNIDFSDWNGSSSPLAHGADLYLNNERFTHLVVPDTISQIKYSTFYGCESLISVIIPDSVVSIAELAFAGCPNLEYIRIPDSVSRMGEFAVSGGDMIGVIYCEAETQPNGWYRSWCSNTPIVWNCKSNNIASDGYVHIVLNGINYGINNDVAVVLKIATSIGIASIPKNIVYNDISYKVTSIYTEAFYNLQHLTIVNIPESITNIDEYAFINCPGLTTVTFEGTIAQWEVISKGDDWKALAPFTVVHCTDGDVSVS